MRYQPRIRYIEAEMLTADNAASIAAELRNGAVTEEGVTFSMWDDETVTMPFGEYVMTNRDNNTGSWPAEDFERDYEPTPDPTNRQLIDSLTARVAALEDR